jgi:hypothetical protein
MIFYYVRCRKLAWSLIRNEKTNCSLGENGHATVKSEAIAWARRCWPSQLTGGQEKNKA